MASFQCTGDRSAEKRPTTLRHAKDLFWKGVVPAELKRGPRGMTADLRKRWVGTVCFTEEERHIDEDASRWPLPARRNVGLSTIAVMFHSSLNASRVSCLRATDIIERTDAAGGCHSLSKGGL